jgi:hypothetical protein
MTEAWMLRVRRKLLLENGDCCRSERDLVPMGKRPICLGVPVRGRCCNVIKQPHDCCSCGSGPSRKVRRAAER